MVNTSSLAVDCLFDVLWCVQFCSSDNAMVIVSRAVEHPGCPEKSDFVRVREYISQMVIIPHSDFDKVCMGER